MKYILAFLITFASANLVQAQTAQDSIKATVNNLFKAMQNADGALLQSTFADSAILQTIVKNKAGKVEVKNESVIEFAAFVSKQEKKIMDEQIVFKHILVDADLAVVWTPYKFYYKGAFSHCGVNSFQLIRINNEWKIQYLIDTRRKNCE